MLSGRVTYQGFAKAWPAMTDEVGFAAKMNGMPKYVVSSTLEKAEWENSTIVRGDVATEVGKLARRSPATCWSRAARASCTRCRTPT